MQVLSVVVGVMSMVVASLIVAWIMGRTVRSINAMDRRRHEAERVHVQVGRPYDSIIVSDADDPPGDRRDIPVEQIMPWLNDPEQRYLLARSSPRGRQLIRGWLNSYENTAQEQSAKAFRKAGPKVFYYLDEEKVHDLYPQAYPKVEPAEVETSEKDGADSSFGAGIATFKGSAGSTKNSEMKATFKIERHVPTMYNRLEDYLFDNNEVIVVPEHYEPQEVPVGEFAEMCAQMKAKFGIEIPEEAKQNYVIEKRSEAASKIVEDVAMASGYVALRAEACAFDQGATLVLQCQHPANPHVVDHAKRLLIELICQKDNLRNSAAVLSEGRHVRVTALGKIISYGDGRLAVNPIAVY